MISAAAHEVIGQAAFDFYKCLKCGRVCTQPEMMVALGPGGSGKVCPCGGLRYSPINLPWLAWCLPRVLSFAWKRIRGQA